MIPPITSHKLTDTLTASFLERGPDHPQGYWLYDSTRKMNLAIAAPTLEAALIEAVSYYQERLTKIEVEYKNINDKVQFFLDQIM